ncbi:MAG: SOS response-associated peptidase family protein [Rhodobacteraceae bacterium]|nr:SOS response-associated peptidase family protein [Paracoccaceae bacterium]
MPGRVFLAAPIDEVAASLSADPSEVSDEPPRHNIAPGQEVIALAPEGLGRFRWGPIPVGRVNARDRPAMETIIDARSETVFDKSAFEGVGRAAMPVNGWYEWSGEKRRKTAWRLQPTGGGLLYFAAITDVWTGPGGIQVPQSAAVTCDPNADVRPIHRRMAAIIAPENVPLWLEGSKPEAAALKMPWPDGALSIDRAEDVDWSGP